MANNPMIKKIHISLDSLIDTRLGTLIKISPEFAYQVSTNKAYYTREEDLFSSEEFGPLDKTTFKEVQVLYQEEIIRGAVMTNLFGFIKELCGALVNKAVATPYYGDIELEINTYPYHFKETELETLIKAISFHLDNLFSISVVYLSPEQLTMDYVANHLTALIMYDPKPWLDLHHRELQKGKLKEIGLYIPALNQIRALTIEELATLNERNMQIFEVLALMLAPFIAVHFLPIALFSANTIENKKEYFI